MHGDDPLDDLGRELRERMEAEMRLEAEMLEHDAALVEKRRRNLSDITLELMSRGDTVTAFAGGRSLRGRLTFARGDIATIETAAGNADLHLAAGVALRIDERRAEGGSAPRPGAASLRARLLEHELEGRAIEVWVPRHAIEVAGRIDAVGADHLIITDRDGTEWLVQLADVAWVRPL